jgi:hypothetical protein
MEKMYSLKLTWVSTVKRISVLYLNLPLAEYVEGYHATSTYSQSGGPHVYLSYTRQPRQIRKHTLSNPDKEMLELNSLISFTPKVTKHEQEQAKCLVKYVANAISSFKNSWCLYEISKGKVKVIFSLPALRRY